MGFFKSLILVLRAFSKALYMWYIAIVIIVLICIIVFIFRVKLFYRCPKGYATHPDDWFGNVCSLDYCEKGNLVWGMGCISCPKSYGFNGNKCYYKGDCTDLGSGVFKSGTSCYSCGSGYSQIPGKNPTDSDACLRTNISNIFDKSPMVKPATEVMKYGDTKDVTIISPIYKNKERIF